MQESVVRSVARVENGSVIFLEPKRSHVVVPIVVQKLEEESILAGMSDMSPSRPQSHDLFIALLHKCAYRLKQVEIYDYKDEVFYARLALQTRKMRVHTIAARPSDAIAIAVRLSVPILIDKKVIQNTAIPTIAIRREERNARVGMEIHQNEVRVDRLESDLQKAVAAEDYEEAARIRDKIQRLR